MVLCCAVQCCAVRCGARLHIPEHIRIAAIRCVLPVLCCVRASQIKIANVHRT